MGIPLHCFAFCGIAWVLEFDAMRRKLGVLDLRGRVGRARLLVTSDNNRQVQRR